MKVKDESAWTDQLTEFEQDDVSRKFRDFLIFWMDTTEKLIELSEAGESSLAPAHPVSKALSIAEQTHGFLSIEWISQMLLVMCEHWVWGETLYDDLTFIEQRLVQQATAMKLLDLQASASQ